MSRQDREAWQAELDADAALKAAWNGFIEQLDRTSPLMFKPGALTKDETQVAVQGVEELRAAARRIYAAVGLPPEDEAAQDDD